MKRRRSAALAGIFLAASVIHAQSGQEPLTFRAVTTTAVVSATVRAKAGALVTNLTAGDFQILDNGSRRPLTSFAHEQVSLTAVIILDLSGSVLPELGRIRAGAAEFVRHLSGSDRAAVEIFAGRDVSLSPFLGVQKRDPLIQVLGNGFESATRGFRSGGGTPLLDGVDIAMKESAHQSERRALLIFTDGDNTVMLQREQNRRDLVARAKKEGCVVYTVFVDSPTLDKEFGTSFAEGTGGGYALLAKDTDISDLMTGVAAQLHHRYLLGFEPIKDGKEHKLDVEVSREGMTVHAQVALKAK